MKHTVLLLVTLLVLSCNPDKVSNLVNDPFNPPNEVTQEALIEAGFEVLPEDVPLLGKYYGDTLVYFQWEGEAPVAMFTQFKSQQSLDALMSSPKFSNIEVQPQDVKGENYLRYRLLNKTNSLVFQCEVERTGEKNEILISYQYQGN